MGRGKTYIYTLKGHVHHMALSSIIAVHLQQKHEIQNKARMSTISSHNWNEVWKGNIRHTNRKEKSKTTLFSENIMIIKS